MTHTSPSPIFFIRGREFASHVTNSTRHFNKGRGADLFVQKPDMQDGISAIGSLTVMGEVPFLSSPSPLWGGPGRGCRKASIK